MTKSHVLVAAFISWTAIAQVGVTPAHAAEYKVVACEMGGRSNTDPGWWSSYSSNPGIGAVNECPRQLRFRHTENVPDAAFASFGSRSQLKIRSVQFTIEGGGESSGIEYEIVAWPPQGIGITRAQLPNRAPDDPPSTFTFATLDSDSFSIIARCRATICTTGPDLVLRDFEFTLEDSTSPMIDEPREGEYFNSQGFFNPNGWNAMGSLRNVTFAGSDNGSGIQSAELRIDDEPVVTLTNTCTVSLVQLSQYPCPTRTTRFTGSIYKPSLAQGWHSLSGSAVDAVGNSATTREYRFGFDSVPPERVSPIRIEGVNEHGWTRFDRHELRWDLIGESEETATESGVVTSGGGFYLDSVPGQFSADNGPDYFKNLRLASDGKWTGWISVYDWAGNEGSRRFFNLWQDSDRPATPVIEQLPWINRGQLIAGVFQRWQPPANLNDLESGICGYSLVYGDGETPDATTEVEGPKTGFMLPTGLTDGVTLLQVRAISCASYMSYVATTELRVDSVAPTITLEQDLESGWITQPTPLRISAHDAHSGVRGISYSLNGTPRTELPGSTAAVAVEDGVHDLRVEATDIAGNKTMPIEKRVMIDTTPPDAWLEPLNPDRPGVVEAVVSDQTSGVASVHLEYAQLGSHDEEPATWHRFGAPVEADPTPGGMTSLRASIPDESLAPGDYRLRVVGTDRAGNVVVTSSRLGGGEDVRTLPLRQRPMLRSTVAPVTARCRSRSVRRQRNCESQQVVDERRASNDLLVNHGTRIAVQGDLRDAAGEPLPGRPLKLYSQPQFGAIALVSQTITDQNGRFEFLLEPGVSRSLTLRFAGADETLPVNSVNKVRVKGTASLRVKASSVGSATRVAISGALPDGGANMPSSGKIYSVDQYRAGHWQPLISPQRTDLRGRLRLVTPLRSRPKRGSKLRFRVHLPAEDNWPYERGFSRVVTITVKR